MVLGAAYVAEGHAHNLPKYSMYGITISSTNQTWLQMLSSRLHRLFPAKSPPIQLANKASENKKPCYTITIGGSLVYVLFVELFGRMSRGVKLPNFVFHLPRDIQEKVIDTLLEGDGYIYREHTDKKYNRDIRVFDNMWGYTTISELLACQFILLASMLGHKLRLTHSVDRESYYIHTSKVMNTNPSGFKATWRTGTEYVYDLETEDSHQFVDAMGLVLLHNSDFSTFLASKNRPSYIIKWPVLWHQWSATFHDCRKTLSASAIMKRSRKLYCEKWGVPEAFSMSPFDYTHPKYMARLPERKVAWLAPTGPMEATDPQCQCPWCQEVRRADS